MKNNNIKTTRFEFLGYKCEAPRCWAFYDLETRSSIGPKYVSKDELLADVDRFAIERGYKS